MKKDNDLLARINLVDLIHKVTPYEGKQLCSVRGGAICDPRPGHEEKKPSFSVFYNGRVWIWHQFSTGESGNAFSYLKSLGYSKTEIFKMLEDFDFADRSSSAVLLATHTPSNKRSMVLSPEKLTSALTGLVPLDENNLHHQQAFKDVQRRGLLHPELPFLVTKGGDLAFQIYGPTGNVTGIKARALSDTSRGKYYSLTTGSGAHSWCSPDYGKAEQVLLVEGELSAMAAWVALKDQPLPYDVQGLPGTSGQLHGDVLKGKTVYLYLDGDEAGRNAIKKLVKKIQDHQPKAIHLLNPLENGQDFCDLLGSTSPAHLKDVLLSLMDGASPVSSGKVGMPQANPLEGSTAATPASSSSDADSMYQVLHGAFHWIKTKSDGSSVPVKLSNFCATVTREIIKTDGVEHQMWFELEGQMSDGTPLTPVVVPAQHFASFSWVMDNWGIQPVISAGNGVKEHLRAAMQHHSAKNLIRSRIYTCTGWMKLPDHGYTYLHSQGGITAAGQVKTVTVELPDALQHYALPDPPQGAELQKAVRASLDLLQRLPAQVGSTLLCLTYLTPLGDVDFTTWIYGTTGSGKSEVCALFTQHFGADMNARQLPGSWFSTSNALEAQAFCAKDALFPVDDFKPAGSYKDIQELQNKAERLLRSQGNKAGRGRMQADGQLKVTKYPRGSLLVTAEDTPREHSAVARTLLLELSTGMLEWDTVTGLQQLAANGVYASAMSAYLQWLAPRLNVIKTSRKAAEAEYRLTFKATHQRTSSAAAHLLFGGRVMLEFALDTGSITLPEAEQRLKHIAKHLQRLVAEQASHQTENDPVTQALRYLDAALDSGQAHLCETESDQQPSVHPERFGWRQTPSGWAPQGIRIGHVDLEEDGNPYYLIPDAFYQLITKMADAQRTSFSMAQNTLWKKLLEKGLIKTEKDRLIPKVTIKDKRPRRLCLVGGYQDRIGGTWGADDLDFDQDEENPCPKDGENTGLEGGSVGGTLSWGCWIQPDLQASKDAGIVLDAASAPTAAPIGPIHQEIERLDSALQNIAQESRPKCPPSGEVHPEPFEVPSDLPEHLQELVRQAKRGLLNSGFVEGIRDLNDYVLAWVETHSQNPCKDTLNRLQKAFEISAKHPR